MARSLTPSCSRAERREVPASRANASIVFHSGRSLYNPYRGAEICAVVIPAVGVTSPLRCSR